MHLQTDGRQADGYIPKPIWSSDKKSLLYNYQLSEENLL